MLAVVGLLLIGITVFVSSAGFEITYGENSFTVDAIGWDDVTVSYADIESIEYRDSCKAGMRTYGFGDAPVQMGIFRNDEFGSYTRYAYSGSEAAVVLHVEGKVLILGGKDAAATKAIYDELSTRK